MLRIIFLCIITLLPTRLTAMDIKLCDKLTLRTKDLMIFSKTEKLFLCGDSNNNPWSSPTESQVKLFMTSFLQSRGFFQPVFRQEGQTLVVETGSKTRVQSLSSDDMPVELDFSRFWVPSRRPLMPPLLDEYEDVIQGRIQAEGYPCPSVEATADAIDGSMTIHANPGARMRVHSIEEPENLGLRPGTLRRYFPIKEGDWFDGDLVHIANERIKAAEILGSSYMISTCTPEGAVISHRSVIGPPRRMTVGFGFNTETFAIARTTYHSARLDENASNFSALLSASYFRQHIESSFEWYFLPMPTSIHFKPTLSFDRRNEKASEERTSKASWHLGAYGDVGFENIRGYIGPNLNLIRTLRGEGPAYARIIEIEANSSMMSHAYEFYRGAPRSGHALDLRYTTASERTNSTLTVRTYSAKGEILFNTLSLEPPLLVFGLRGKIANSDATADTELPDEYLHYIGGSDDVRGFRRRTVPSTTKGARSLMSGGMELRLLTIFPYGLQPFLFLDGGRIGDRAFTYEPTVYYSPGAGIRWQSPFGSLRGSVARGLLHASSPERADQFPPQWLAFVSFGEEF